MRVSRHRSGNTGRHYPTLRRNGIVYAVWLAVGSSALALAVPHDAHAQAAAQQAQGARQSYSIPAGPLAPALRSLASSANLLLTFTAEQTTGKTTAGLQGQYTQEEAISALLAQSGLRAVKLDNGGYVLRAVPVAATNTAPAASIQEPALPTVTVRAQSVRDGAAENGYLAGKAKTLGVWGDVSLQDTPYSLSIVPKDFLENTVASEFKEIAKRNPLLLDGGAGNKDNGGISTSIRGFGVSTVSIDGIPLNGAYYGYGIEETDRIEILSGLSGFLYGAGNVGGTINYVLKRPTENPFTKVTVGNSGGTNFYTEVDTSGRVDKEGKLTYRLNALLEDGERVRENNNRSNKYASAAFDWRPTDGLLLGLYASHRDIKENGVAYWSISDTGNMPDVSMFDNTKAYAPDWTLIANKSDKVEVKADYAITPDIKLRMAYLHFKSDMRRKQAENSFDTTTNTFGARVSESIKQEGAYDGAILYLDKQFSLGSTKHLLTVGGSLGTDKYYIRGGWDTRPGWAYPAHPIGSLDGFMDYGFSDLPNSARDPGNYRMRNNTNKSFVVGDNITINDRWSALIGLNHATVTAKNYNSSGSVTGQYDDSKVTPTVSLIFKPLANLSTYATYIEALQGGNVVGDTYANAGEVLPPYVSKQVELGAKYTVNDALLLSTALFRIEKANSYEDRIRNLLTQDGLQVNQGVELLVTGKATDDLTLMGGLTYVDTQIKKSSYAWSPEGKEATGVAKVQAKMYAEYRLPVSPKIFLNGGIYHTGAQWIDSSNTQKLPAYTLVDIGTRYETSVAGNPTTFRIYASNVFNKKYWANASWSSYLGDPRTVGFSVDVKF